MKDGGSMGGLSSTAERGWAATNSSQVFLVKNYSSCPRTLRKVLVSPSVH